MGFPCVIADNRLPGAIGISHFKLRQELGFIAIELKSAVTDVTAIPAIRQHGAEDILTAHPKLDAMFCSNESGTIGVVQGAKSKGVAGKLRIVGFDSSPTVLEDLEAGSIDSLVVQNPFRMGYLAVETLVKNLRGETPEKRIDTGATLVTAANLKDRAIQDLINPPIDQYLK